MNHFVLGGGKQSEAVDGGQAFVGAMLRMVKNDVRIALCHFATMEDQWEEASQVTAKFISEHVGKIGVAYKTMNINNFVEISSWADVIYLTDGNSYLLKDTLLGFKDVSPIWQGKTIVGTSAGADVLCHKYVYLPEKRIGQGLGWVSCDLFTHYRSDYPGWAAQDWIAFEEQFAADPASKFSVLCLPEGDFAEFVT